MTRRGHLARVVVCPYCGEREVMYLPHAQFGKDCPEVRRGDKWRWFIDLDEEGEGT